MNLGNFKDLLVFWKKEEDTDSNVHFIKPLCKEVVDKKQKDTLFYNSMKLKILGTLPYSMMKII